MTQEGEMRLPEAVGQESLDEVAGDLQRAIDRHMVHVIREWTSLLDEATRRHEREQWGSERSQEESAQLLEFTRWALEGLERIGSGVPPDRGHLAPADHAWVDVVDSVRRDEAGGREFWDRIRQAAADDLESGRAGALAVEGAYSRPMERAEYLAVWTALADGLQPRTGLDRLLIDGMAEAWTMHRRWLHKHVLRDSLDSHRMERDERERDRWRPPMQDDADAIEQAAMMADRFQRSFLRLLKTYRDQRRLLGSVIVAAGGQINVAEQQINVGQQ